MLAYGLPNVPASANQPFRPVAADLEAMYGLPALGNAASTGPIGDTWN